MRATFPDMISSVIFDIADGRTRIQNNANLAAQTFDSVDGTERIRVDCFCVDGQICGAGCCAMS
jgi:hypothetical protein